MKIKGKIFLLAVCLAVVAVLMPKAQGEILPYYSGDAVVYFDRVIFGSANTGALEIFTLINNEIFKTNHIVSDDRDYFVFHDLAFHIEESRLYLYAVNGRYLYKYDVSNLADARLLEKKQDNSEDLFFGIGAFGEHIMTVGTRSIKIWNKNMQVVSDYFVNIKFPRSIALSPNGNYLFDTTGSSLKIVDAFYRNIISETPFSINQENDRFPYYDPAEGATYVVGDASLKKIHFNGGAEEFNHISDFGYDAFGLPGRPHVYFTDGIGIVKVNKSDMRPIDWAYTTALGAGNGWAVGLRVVADSMGEKAIVFNGSSILAMDNELNLIDFYAAQDEYNVPLIKEPLNLTSDKRAAFPNNFVNLSGSGFGFNEELEIAFADDKYYARTDREGRFRIMLKVPDVKPRIADIKVDGQVSKLTYSITFEIL